jgi:DNA-binding transcriptional MocR family regulator
MPAASQTPSVSLQPILSKAPEAGEVYRQIADHVLRLIEAGTFQTGERVPSVRQLAREFRVSVSSAVLAYRHLETRGILESRPQSGYFVRHRPAPLLSRAVKKDLKVGAVPTSHLDFYVRILTESRRPDLLQFGAAIPNPAHLPTERLDRFLASAARAVRRSGLVYDIPPGCEALRIQIAQRSLQAGLALAPDDLITTNGCLEALTLALRATCNPGDTVAIETPAYVGALQVLQFLNLRVLEIPASTETGMDLSALEFAMDHHEIRAVVVTTNFSNPTGSLMPDSNKSALVAMLADRQIPLIEDDLYGNLIHQGERPCVAKAFDRNGMVILCSSFSKELAPGYRIGWIAAGRWHDTVLRLKTGLNVSTATISQRALAEFLAAGRYDHHLRTLRKTYGRLVQETIAAVGRHFPAGTVCTRPRGGQVTWVRLPDSITAQEAYQAALEVGISVAPGPLFSPSGGYNHHIRLNCAYWSPEADPVFAKLGSRLHRLVR